jgi:hypothetical protein
MPLSNPSPLSPRIHVQDIIQSSAMQPFIKLAQGNMQLLTEFSTSPEVAHRFQENAQNLFKQGQESTTQLLQSNAFMRMMQGMMKNYSEFMLEFSQSGMAVLAQGQQQMLNQVQEATETAVDATARAARRAR